MSLINNNNPERTIIARFSYSLSLVLRLELALPLLTLRPIPGFSAALFFALTNLHAERSSDIANLFFQKARVLFLYSLLNASIYFLFLLWVPPCFRSINGHIVFYRDTILLMANWAMRVFAASLAWRCLAAGADLLIAKIATNEFKEPRW